MILGLGLRVWVVMDGVFDDSAQDASIYIYRALIALLQVLSKAALRWVGSSGKGLRMCWGLGFGLGQLCVVAHL